MVAELGVFLRDKGLDDGNGGNTCDKPLSRLPDSAVFSPPPSPAGRVDPGNAIARANCCARVDVLGVLRREFRLEWAADVVIPILASAEEDKLGVNRSAMAPVLLPSNNGSRGDSLPVPSSGVGLYRRLGSAGVPRRTMMMATLVVHPRAWHSWMNASQASVTADTVTPPTGPPNAVRQQTYTHNISLG
jgi:hypothetical protein